MIQVVCKGCLRVQEFTYTKMNVSTLIKDGWRGDNGFLYCPECAKYLRTTRSTKQTMEYTQVVFLSHRRNWFNEHPAPKNPARFYTNDEWLANFKKDWDAARHTVQEGLRRIRDEQNDEGDGQQCACKGL